METKKVNESNKSNLKLSAEMQKKIANINAEKFAKKTAKKGNKSFWIEANVISDFGTEIEQKKAEQSKDSAKQLMKKYRRKLRDMQANLALSFVSDLQTNSARLDKSFKEFAEFNKRYIYNCKETFTNRTEESDKDMYDFLQTAYSAFNEMQK